MEYTYSDDIPWCMLAHDIDENARVVNAKFEAWSQKDFEIIRVKWSTWSVSFEVFKVLLLIKLPFNIRTYQEVSILSI